MRLEIREDGRKPKSGWRDLMMDENSWNGAKEIFNLMTDILLLVASKCTTREKFMIQPPNSASETVMTWEHPMARVLA